MFVRMLLSCPSKSPVATLPFALLMSPLGLGARWGPTDPGAASCIAGFVPENTDIRLAKEIRAVAGMGSFFLGSYLRTL